MEDDGRKYYHRVAWTVAGFFVVMAVAVSLHLIVMHNRNWTNPLLQRKIVGILWMVPIYAVNSWLSLVFIHSAVYLDMFRDCYEAYVIYLFLALMIAFLGQGNDYKVVEIIEELEPLTHPFPFNHFWPPIIMDASFLRKCKLATVQFVLVKPLMTFIAAFLESKDSYDQGHFRFNRGYLYVCFIQNVSITYAFYQLVLFYVALKDHLRPFNPVPKFICIKAVLFLSFWQGVFIAALAQFEIIHQVGSWSVENVSTGAQNLLLCFEMFLAALAHYYAFPYAVYSKQGRGLRRNLMPTMRGINLRDQLAINEYVNDFNEVMPGRILLPSTFRPGAPTIITHENSTPVTNDAVEHHGNARFVFGDSPATNSIVDSSGNLNVNTDDMIGWTL